MTRWTTSGFNSAELRLLARLDSPPKIQSFLNELVANFEEDGPTCMSPRAVIESGRAHCVEGAILAAAALRLHGEPARLVELETTNDDYSHVIAVFRRGDHWGAIGKTNHAVLRYRDPVYRSLRELAMSFFHEYFLNSNGVKTLRRYTRAVDLSQFDDRGWTTSDDDIGYIPDHLERARHYDLLLPWQVKALRRADEVEREAGRIVVDRAPDGILTNDRARD